MKTFILGSLLLAAMLATAAEPQVPANAVTLRVRFGMKDTETVDWSGGVTAMPGKVADIRGWRWTPMDKAEGSSWNVRTRPIPIQGRAQREKGDAGKKMPIGDNGVIITLARVSIIKDDEVVHTLEPNQKEVSLSWSDVKAVAGKTSYYYIRGEQVPDLEGATGEIVWVSPMWIKYQP